MTLLLIGTLAASRAATDTASEVLHGRQTAGANRQVLMQHMHLVHAQYLGVPKDTFELRAITSANMKELGVARIAKLLRTRDRVHHDHISRIEQTILHHLADCRRSDRAQQRNGASFHRQLELRDETRRSKAIVKVHELDVAATNAASRVDRIKKRLRTGIDFCRVR